MPYGELLRSRDPVLSLSRRVPVGVVGVISPFNFPLILSIRAVAPALALGNAVILKPDPRTSVAGGVTLARIFEEAGVPEGVFHVMTGGVDVGEAVVADPNIAMVSFTGSTRGGRQVGALAAKHLKKCHLELGGNSALIVLDDVDVDKAVSVGAFGSFMHQGQICMTTGRHLVQRGISDQYTATLAAHAEHTPVGNPATDQVALGPIIDEKQRDNVHRIVTESVAQGARLAAGGTFEGLFYRPTVLGDVPTDSPAYLEEIFGPVAPVVPFDSVDEAVKLASETEYGLSLGILTNDVMKGLEIADRIPSGVVHINDQTIGDEVVNPFGGVKGTGSAWLGGPRSEHQRVHPDAVGDDARRPARIPLLTRAVAHRACARRSGSSEPDRPASCSRTCCTSRASSRSCSRPGAASTSSNGCAPVCWSRRPSSCCARPGSASAWTVRA